MYPSVLHIRQKEIAPQKDTEHERSSESCTTSSTCGHTGAGHLNGILSLFSVQVKSSKGNKVIGTYAFLDPRSTGTFCSENLLYKLNTQEWKAKIHLRTMGQDRIVSSSGMSLGLRSWGGLAS